MLVRDKDEEEIGTPPPVDQPPPAEVGEGGNAAPAVTAELFTCSECEMEKPGGEMSSLSDLCLRCEGRKKESDRWADMRARGRAAFVKHDSNRDGTFTRGKAVMYCLLCDQLLVGRGTIERHAKRCVKK